MSVLHGLTYGDEQFESLFDHHSFPVAILGERYAVDKFHDEERLAGFGDTAIVNAGDVRVVHHGQGLTLGVEAC